MIKISCEKCRVIIPEEVANRLYGTHRICMKCYNKWTKEEFKRLKVKHHELNGWRAWKPVFEEWLQKVKREKVVFT